MQTPRPPKPLGFEPTVPASEGPQTYASDRAASEQYIFSSNVQQNITDVNLRVCKPRGTQMCHFRFEQYIPVLFMAIVDRPKHVA
jgi:hypothetical protein